MTNELSSSEVWNAIIEERFAVLGMVTARNECRTVGVNAADDHRLYIRQIETRGRPGTSSVIRTSRSRFRFPSGYRCAWVKIPAATITFSGIAKVHEKNELSPEVSKKVFNYVDHNDKLMATTCLIEVTPEKDFLTYGIGIPMIQMRDHEKARARVLVHLA